MQGKAYAATGVAGGIGSGIWEYDLIIDLRGQKTYLKGVSRIGAVGFEIGERGYVATGQNGSYFFDNLWAYEPDVEFDEYD